MFGKSILTTTTVTLLAWEEYSLFLTALFVDKITDLFSSTFSPVIYSTVHYLSLLFLVSTKCMYIGCIESNVTCKLSWYLVQSVTVSESSPAAVS
jgi:hypothetical protein